MTVNLFWMSCILWSLNLQHIVDQSPIARGTAWVMSNRIKTHQSPFIYLFAALCSKTIILYFHIFLKNTTLLLNMFIDMINSMHAISYLRSSWILTNMQQEKNHYLISALSWAPSPCHYFLCIKIDIDPSFLFLPHIYHLLEMVLSNKYSDMLHTCNFFFLYCRRKLMLSYPTIMLLT